MVSMPSLKLLEWTDAMLDRDVEGERVRRRIKRNPPPRAVLPSMS
jgi:hypothetical protein